MNTKKLNKTEKKAIMALCIYYAFSIHKAPVSEIQLINIFQDESNKLTLSIFNKINSYFKIIFKDTNFDKFINIYTEIDIIPNYQTKKEEIIYNKIYDHIKISFKLNEIDNSYKAAILYYLQHKFNLPIKNTYDKLSKDFVVNAAHMNGRILVLNSRCGKESTGHGSPLPLLTHGGPGRAGGGEEMGGKRGILHYLQRTAIQGHPSTITEITQQFQIGAATPEANPHVFRKHFEELVVGETVFTHKHTVTDADIVNFANVSGDNFYAHMDATSLDGTIFEQRVAHGYFILSKAAGLFVDPKKGPVLLNYGLDEARFIKPVYPGATIGVRFTVKEKLDQEKRSDDDIAKGIVRFLVDVYDETGETVALATILTMVRKLDQSQ